MDNQNPQVIVVSEVIGGNIIQQLKMLPKNFPRLGSSLLIEWSSGRQTVVIGDPHLTCVNLVFRATSALSKTQETFKRSVYINFALDEHDEPSIQPSILHEPLSAEDEELILSAVRKALSE